MYRWTFSLIAISALGNAIARSSTEIELFAFDPFVNNTLEISDDGDDQAVSNDIQHEVPVALNSVTLDVTFLREVKNLVGGRRYIFAFENLPLNDEIKARNHRNHPLYYIGRLPCHWYGTSWSSFKRVDASFCTGEYKTIHADTEALFSKLLQSEFGHDTPKLKNVLRRNNNNCHSNDKDVIDLGFVQGANGVCWKHVHPLEGNIYDMTFWFENSADIEDWVDISLWNDGTDEEAILTLPEGYGNQWIYDIVHYHQNRYPHVGKLDDVILFKNLPDALATPEVEARFSETTVDTVASQDVIICGSSTGELANKDRRDELLSCLDWF